MHNISSSFTFVFRDPDWPKKLLIGGLFTFLSVFLIGIPVLYGYYIELLQRVRRNEQYPLPEWKDPGVKFITGLKYLAVFFVYILPLLFLLVPLLFLFLTGIFMRLSGNDYQLLESASVSLIFVVIPYSVTIYYITPLISISFSDKESIRDGLSLFSVFSSSRAVWRDLFIVGIFSFAIQILAGIGLIFFIVGILFTSFYAKIVIFHLYGQIANTMNIKSETR